MDHPANILILRTEAVAIVTDTGRGVLLVAGRPIPVGEAVFGYFHRGKVLGVVHIREINYFQYLRKYN
jgi:hypothetical protein